MMMNKSDPREQEIQKLIEKVLENGVDRVDDDRYGEYSECPYCFGRGELHDKMEDIKHDQDCMWIIARGLQIKNINNPITKDQSNISEIVSCNEESTTDAPDNGDEVFSVYYGVNREDFSELHPEEAAQSAWESDGEYNIGDTIEIYSLKFRKCRGEKFLHYKISEVLEENAYDAIGERSLDWTISNSDKLQDVVETAIKEWLDATDNQPSLWEPSTSNPEVLLYRFTSEYGDSELV